MISISVRKPLLGAEGSFELAVDLEVQTGTFITLFGPSGSGKTTFIRMVAGLETPASGRLSVNDEVWFDSAANINLSPQLRRVGLVFQNYSLFPNMTVGENLRFAQGRKDEGKITEILELIGLTGLRNRYPTTLSGGQQQRVALARAIVREPKLLLLDEPLSALDTIKRLRLQDEISRIHSLFHLTTILVSHDKQEVFKLSDKVAVMEHGRIVKYGDAKDIFLEQQTSNKFSFVGTILSIKPVDIAYLAVIGVGNELVEVVLDERDLAGLRVGDKVLVAAKAFNPIIKKI